MEYTTKEIAHLIGGEIQGSDVKIRTLSKIEEAQEGAIAFLSNPKYENYIYSTSASAVIVNKSFIPKNQIKPTLILVEDAYTSFTTLLEEYTRIQSFQKTGTEQPCYLGKNSHIGKNIYRGAFSYIGDNVKIGENVKIYPYAYIGDNVSIGNNTIIYAGAKIYTDCIIGNYCTIHSGAVIGSDGFGFAPQKDGSFKDIPQVGNVVLENHVNIGANTVIDCATIGSTIIREGVKLDNLIQIAHNVEIGKNTVMAAQSGISGSTKIGANCMIGGQAGFAGHLKIANRSNFAAQSGIGANITEEGKAYMGSPAFDYGKYFRSAAIFRKLPDLRKRIEELEQKIVILSSPVKN